MKPIHVRFVPIEEISSTERAEEVGWAWLDNYLNSPQNDSLDALVLTLQRYQTLWIRKRAENP